MKTPRTGIKRRQFLGGMMKGIIAGAIAPSFIPMRVFAGQNTPGKKIQLGHIGTGNQGTFDLRNFLAADGAASIAVCDPFRERRERAAGFIKSTQNVDAKLYNDYRELLANPEIDAVVIATPDHWHVPIGLAAVKAGKDVYIEKPLSHCLRHNFLMAEACKKYNRIFQYGTQQRSQEIIKRGVELVLNGYIGDLQRIDVWAPQGKGGGSLVETPVPEGLDYELYIGPAPMKPCTKDRTTNQASWFCSDYAIGFIAGWGAHPLDVAIWGMNSDTKGPVSFSGTGTYPTPDALFDTCASWDVKVEFADKVSLHFMSTDLAAPLIKEYLEASGTHTSNNGTTFFGSKGWVSMGRSHYAASNMDWFKLKSCEGSKRVLYHNKYYKSFTDSVRDRSPSIAPIEDALRSDALSHLSLLAIKNKTTVVWDPQAYKIQSPNALNAQMDIPVRGDWLKI